MANISYYSKCFLPKEQQQMEELEVIEIIKSGELKKHTDYLRQEKNKDKRQEYKKNHLPAVTFQGSFYERRFDKLIKASGLATLDIDLYDQDLTEIKIELEKSPYVKYIFVSPSGGLKVIVSIPVISSDQEYKIIYPQLVKHYAKYAPKSDEKTKDISRLCFLSYDPQIYINKHTKVFPVDWDYEPPTEIFDGGSKINISEVIKGVGEGDRDDAAFRLACRYKGKKLEREEVLLMVSKWNENNNPPLTEQQIQKCVNSAFRYKDKEDEPKEITLKEVHSLYKNLLYIEDTDRIDVVLAVALSSKLPGIPLWLFIVGPSGDMKSVQLNSFEGEEYYTLHNLTSKTLVNGHANKTKYPDLAPILNNKIVIIPDMAQILKLPPVEKGELWGQLRDLYDGLAGKVSGMGSSAKYDGLKVTILAGSTPAIDGQILVHQDLGTRELVYRTTGSENKRKVMEKCFENEELEKEISDQLKYITSSFIQNKKVERFEVKKEILEEIKNIAIYITYMRASAEFDNYSNELRNIVYPEEPTRISKQLKRLYVCLKNLSKDYSDEKAFDILWHVARSSAFPIRIRLFDFMVKNTESEYSTSQISEFVGIGKSTAKRECSVLESLGLVKCRHEPTGYPDKFVDKWQANEPKIETFLKEIGGVHKYNRKIERKKGIYTIISMDGEAKQPSEAVRSPSLDIVEENIETQDVVIKEKFYHKCSFCGTDTADSWHKGKPVCELCSQSLIANGEYVEKN